MKKKIFLYYLILIIAIMGIVVIFTSEVARKFYKSEVEKKLTSQVYAIEFYASNSAQKPIDFDKIARDYAAAYNEKLNSVDENIRITFVDLNGIVKGDSEADYRSMENHISRPEVASAIKGETGVAIRKSATLNTDMIYVAVPFEQYGLVARVAAPLAELSNINTMIWFYSILVILFGLLIVIFFSLRISESIIKPIRDFSEVSKEISKGNYSKRVDVRTKDELGELADSFNTMAVTLDKTIFDLNYKKIEMESIVDSIKNSIIAVDTFNKIIMINPSACEMFKIPSDSKVHGDNFAEHVRNAMINNLLKETMDKNQPVEKEIMEGDRLLMVNTCPIRKKDEGPENAGAVVFIQDITKIRKLEEMRTEFVSNVTHELKTPITSIRGFIETLKSGAIENPEVAGRFLDIIDIEAERLHDLIEDILQLSEIENKTEDMGIEKVNLSEAVEDVFAIMQKHAQINKTKLINDVSPNIYMNINKNRLKQLLLNLVDNGVKYNMQEGSVTVSASHSEDKTYIFVKDTGIGIPKEQLGRVFERFYRVDKGRSRDLGGTGLGLSIVKHIANLYSGDVSVDSELGRGTEFTVQIPD